MICPLANLWLLILILLSYNWITGFGSDLGKIRDLGQPVPTPKKEFAWHVGYEVT